MKAYVLHGVGDLRYEELPIPECPHGWAIVKVKATGICSSDIPRVFTKGTYHFPTIPGHEFSGVVEKVGDDKDRSWVSKHVGVFPLIPCRECQQCKEMHFEMCSDYDYIGSRRDGAFAEYVAVPVWNLIPLTDNLPFTTAAMLEPLSVALHAINLGHVKEGDNVCIVGTGMIGIAAGLWAKQLNANSVTIIGRSEGKRILVEHCGLQYATETTKEYDFVLEAVGTPKAIASAILATRPGGRLVLMGNPSGDILFTQDIYWRILRKQLCINGTWNSVYDGTNKSDWTKAVTALENNEINVEPLISHQFCQENMVEGLKLMRDKNETYCKVMTTWNN